MRIPRCIVVLAFFLAFLVLCAPSWALKVELTGTKQIEAERTLWKPTSLSKLSDEAFCFQASDVSCGSHPCPETVLCSLDYGSTFMDAPVTLPFCGPRGVLLGGQLLCPAELLPRSQPNEAAFAVVSFQVEDHAITETINAEKQFVFHHSAALSTIEFTGMTLYLDSEDQYFMVATVLEDDEDRRVTVLFVSEDGLTWETKSEIPLEGDEFYLTVSGAGALFVFARAGETFKLASSKYMGKWWSDVQLLNTTAPPFMAPLFGSGVTIEYATDNTSRNLYLAYGTDRQKAPARIRIPESMKGSKECATSSNYVTGAVLRRDTNGEVLTLHDCDQHLYVSTFIVDDSAEAAKKAKKEADRREKAAAAEEAKLKAKAAKLERQRKERRERRRKEQDRKRRFLEADVPHWELATKHFEEDGEWIVVRKVNKDTTDLEKKTFFPDMI